MPPNRSRSRNVLIEFSSAPGVVQGGLRAPSNLTSTQFLDMLHVVFSAPGGFEARLSGSNAPLSPSSQAVQSGCYILTPYVHGQQMQTSNARFFPRTFSPSNTSREEGFRIQVQARDGRCVITGDPNYDADDDEWFGFEAAHIFPIALDTVFRSLNPHDDYKVQAFSRNAWRYHGKVLHPICRQPSDSRRVIDDLLHWHYEQAVLCNMRGAGEPSFEHDFPPGTDMMGEIMEGPQSAERMEAELFTRLHGMY